MANLKKIRTRINSIKSTQKITRAMKMVASAKVKKFENRVKASRPFTFELEKMFLSMLSNDIIIADWQYCVKQEPVETGLIFKEAGFEEGTAGENLGYGFWTPEEVCQAWKDSRTHYNNIINPKFKQIGIGVAADPDERGKLVWATHFLSE